MRGTLFDLLDGYGYKTLRRIADFNNIVTPTSKGRKLRKDALIKALCEQLFTENQIKRAFAHLNNTDRAVLTRLLWRGGEVITSAFRNELQSEGIVQSSPCYKEPSLYYEGDHFHQESNCFDDIIARLTLHGLVFSSDTCRAKSSKLDLRPGSQLIAPEPVRSYISQLILPAVEWGSGNLQASVEETSTIIAQRELFIYWNYVRAQSVPLTQAGFVPKRILRTINEQLISPDRFLANATHECEAPRLYFMRLLLQELGLLAPEHSLLCAVGQRNQVPAFWKQSVEERAKACLEAWLHLKDWSELTNLSMSSFNFDLLRARSALLEQLRLIQPGLWVSAERFRARLALVTPRLFLQTKDSYPEVAYTQGPNRLTQHKHWVAELEAAFVDGAVSGPLHWLGILDVSVDEGHLLAFRINASGARVLNMKPMSEEEYSSQARVIIQPNFQIFALGPVSEATLAMLELFANRVKADRSVFEYVLSRETVYRGQKQGLSVSEIIAFLEQTAGVALPQNVLRTLQEWGEQHERIIFHRAVTLCQTATPELLQQLWDDPTLKIHLERQLSSTVALVKRGHMATLREALLKRNILPAISHKNDSYTGRVQATAQGELRPIHEGPDLVLEAHLRELAEEQGGRFYITEAAVTKALAAGKSIPEYLAQLAKLHHGPIPATLRSRIKAWGRYYGKASLQKAILLEVKDSATAEELLEDEELATSLSRFAADPQGKLLIVHTDDLEALRRRLRDRGIELT